MGDDGDEVEDGDDVDDGDGAVDPEDGVDDDGDELVVGVVELMVGSDATDCGSRSLLRRTAQPMPMTTRTAKASARATIAAVASLR